MDESNVDIANSLFEDKILEIMDVEAPMETVQICTKYNNWISRLTKEEMLLRDRARNKAKLTDDLLDWEDYRRRRNACIAMQKKDKVEYQRNLYSKIEIDRDSGCLFKQTRTLLGWKSAGPPTCFLVGGRAIRKQQDIAETQASYYQDKINQIKEDLPKVNIDPLSVLKRFFRKWIPAGGRPKFELKSVETGEILNMKKKS